MAHIVTWRILKEHCKSRKGHCIVCFLCLWTPWADSGTNMMEKKQRLLTQRICMDLHFLDGLEPVSKPPTKTFLQECCSLHAMNILDTIACSIVITLCDWSWDVPSIMFFGTYLCGDGGGKHARSKRVEVEQFKVAKTYRIRMWHTKYNPASCCNAPPMFSLQCSCKLKTVRQLHNRSIVLIKFIKQGTLWSPAIIWAYRQAPYLCFCCLLSQGICSLPRHRAKQSANI